MASSTTFDSLRKAVRGFARAREGNITLTFALLLVPIMATVGAAVDYSMSNKVRTELQAAADAAAVGSIAKSSVAFTTAPTMSKDGSISAGVTDALNIFNSIIAKKLGFTLGKVTAKVAKANGTITSTVSFTATVPTFVMGLLGKKKITVTGTSTAANSVPTFVDFYLLLDNSPSMGLGATLADINKMVANTPDQCAFACHDLSTAPKDYYSLGKKLGISMRIDVLRTATQKLMDTAENTETFSNQFRMAIYTLGASCTNPGLTTISTLTSNLSSAKAAAKNIDLMTIPYQGYNSDQCTNFDAALTAINTAIPSPGDGTSSSSPQKFVFFVSDGVADANNPLSCSKPVTSTTRCQEPIDVAFCTTIKNRGTKIAILYTTYLPLPTNAWYNSWIAPFSNEIGPKMQSCASPGLYFEVSPTQGIPEAMDALFKKAVAQARLTQ